MEHSNRQGLPFDLEYRQVARDGTVRWFRNTARFQFDGEGQPNSVIRLAEQLFATPVITAARVEAMVDVTRPTAQAAIDALVERGDLTEITGRTRGRVYEAGAIFEAVYGPVPIEESTVHPELPFG